MKYLISVFLLVFSIQTNANFPIFVDEIFYHDRYQIYHSIDFGDNAVDQDVFNYALKGYCILKNEGELEKENILTIIDYSKSSVEKRLWVIDLKQREVLYNEWVSHGKYTGNEYSENFSNTISSKKSSLGFFVTGYTYSGKHKYSLKLHGLEEGHNHNAFKRGIVIHGAHYVSEEFIKRHNRLGRSYGCPAIRHEIKDELIKTIKEGSCLFSYYPSDDYLFASELLTQEVE